jgi:hypothetical protein
MSGRLKLVSGNASARECCARLGNQLHALFPIQGWAASRGANSDDP